MERQRQEHVDAILHSDARKKIVVAGPGTGKTYLFKKVLSAKNKTLTLTFVNALVEDLALELFGLSEVRTLHGFARQQLKRATKKTVRIFPKLSTVIGQDALSLRGVAVDFDTSFHNKSDIDNNIEFYRKRRVYYDHYGFADMVYAAVLYFEKHPEKIPLYSQVVVDEFQDFNKLEVALIDQLASKSPILLVGDDDQALYKTLKFASATHIRQRYTGDLSSIYQRFTLPYCSRCTHTIVEAVNDFISSAKQAGYLRDRIDKPFLYFDCEQKNRESECNPQIVYQQVFEKQIPWLIQKKVTEIATEVKNKFDILLISPTRKQCNRIVTKLREKGFQNIHYGENQERSEPTLMDGLNLLLQDDKSNLGWRVVAMALLLEDEFKYLLKQTNIDYNPPPICEIAKPDWAKEVRTMLKTLRSVRDGNTAADWKQVANLFERLGFSAGGLVTDYLRDQIGSPIRSAIDPGIKKVPIKATTIPSSKGLAADYVFISHFDDQYFIKDRNKSHVSDQDICSFLVALTRARKKVFLISTNSKKEPTFLKWINKERICTL